MTISLDDPHDRRTLLWADERSCLPADHPDHISRALQRIEAEVDTMIAAMHRELGEEPLNGRV